MTTASSISAQEPRASSGTGGEERYPVRPEAVIAFAVLTLVLLIWGGYQLVPDLQRYVPLGVVQQLLEQGEPGDLSDIVIRASNVTDEVSGLLWLIMAILGAVALMVPVTRQAILNLKTKTSRPTKVASRPLLQVDRQN